MNSGYKLNVIIYMVYEYIYVLPSVIYQYIYMNKIRYYIPTYGASIIKSKLIILVLTHNIGS